MSPQPTDFSHAGDLSQKQLEGMIGDDQTIIPEAMVRPAHWSETNHGNEEPTLGGKSTEQGDLEAKPPSEDVALTTPLVRASAYDFTLTETGVEAHVPPDHVAPFGAFGLDCTNRMAALIDNARSIAGDITNKLGEATKSYLTDYALHLAEQTPPNPYRLSFLAGRVKRDLADPLVSDGYSDGLREDITTFTAQHDAFFAHCLPAANEAEETKRTTNLTRPVTKQEVTEVLDGLDAAIGAAEASTESLSAALSDFRAYDDELNRFQTRVVSPADEAKLDAAVTRETVEVASFTSRLYFRAKQVVARLRLHAGDLAIAGTLTGLTLRQMAETLIHRLQPIMQKLNELLTALPPA